MPEYTRLGPWIVDVDRIVATKFEKRSAPPAGAQAPHLDVYTDDGPGGQLAMTTIVGDDAESVSWVIRQGGISDLRPVGSKWSIRKAAVSRVLLAEGAKVVFVLGPGRAVELPMPGVDLALLNKLFADVNPPRTEQQRQAGA